MSERTLRVVVATPLPEQLRDLIPQREPRIDLVHDPALLPPMRWAGDYAGDPAAPDGLFPNNVFATVPGGLVVGRMRHPVRQREALRDDSLRSHLPPRVL